MALYEACNYTMGKKEHWYGCAGKIKAKKKNIIQYYIHL